MVLARRPLALIASTVRQRSAIVGRRSAARQSWHQVRARGYATGGDHGHAKPSSDMPWLIGSVGVTVPLCWYIGIYTPDPNAHHEEHEEHEEHEDAEGHENSPSETSESSDESNSEGEDKTDVDDKSDGGNEKQDTPDTSDDEDSNEKADNPTEKPTKTKTTGEKQSTNSGKEEGVSNTNARHSTDVGNDPDKSKKPEQGPDTAKVKGTIDTNRSQV